MKVMLRPGLPKLYVQLKTPEGNVNAFAKPGMVYEVVDGFDQQPQFRSIGNSDAAYNTFSDLLDELGVPVLDKTTNAPPCCPNSKTDTYTYLPFVPFDEGIYQEVTE